MEQLLKKPFNIAGLDINAVGALASNYYEILVFLFTSEVYYTAMSGFIDKMMKATFATPEKISQTILQDIIDHQSPSLRIAGTIDSHFFGLMRRFLPRRLYHFILYYSLPSSIRIKIKQFMKILDRK